MADDTSDSTDGFDTALAEGVSCGNFSFGGVVLAEGKVIVTGRLDDGSALIAMSQDDAEQLAYTILAQIGRGGDGEAEVPGVQLRR
jgi:hypothetical protein